jgi:Putative adhesin
MLPLTTGRRVALAIGVPLCLVLTANTGFDIVANVGRGKVPVVYDAPVGIRKVSVATSGGDVQLRQGSGDRASFAGTGIYSLVRPRVTERLIAGVTNIGYQCRVPEGECELDGTLTVPAGMAASVSTGGGQVTADGMTGAVTLSTGGGNVSASGVSGPLSLDTGGGDIQATGITTAQVSADIGGGDIEIVFTKVPRTVRVSTGGGDITIVVPPGGTHYRVVADAGGGNLDDPIPIDSSSPNLITATTGGGNITIRWSS